MPGIMGGGRSRSPSSDSEMAPSNLSDGDLLGLLKAGSEEAFVALYRRRQGGIYRFALHMSGHPDVAEEVTQEVFLALIRNPGQYDPERGSVAAFLYGVARNHVLRRIDQDRRYLPLTEGSEDEGEGLWSPWLVGLEDPYSDLDRTETIERVRQGVLALPLAYREVVVLCDLQELDYAEAARTLKCPVGTVRSRLHRARTLLMRKLRGWHQGEANPKPHAIVARGL
ncbi:MAG: RNA polymerase sigma factor [Terriglobia bacterium]